MCRKRSPTPWMIAERCNVDLDPEGYHLPLFEVPEGYTAETYLRELCEEGLRRRYREQPIDPKCARAPGI